MNMKKVNEVEGKKMDKNKAKGREKVGKNVQKTS